MVAPTTAKARGRRSPRTRWAPVPPSLRRTLLVALVVAVIGFAVRLGLVLRGGGLFGLGTYDDGVYFAAAADILHGRFPYRDFLLLHPPGLPLELTPFALLGRLIGDSHAFAIARVAWLALGGLNAGLVVLVLRRFGLTAATTGGIFYALFIMAAYGEHSIALETLGTTGVLGALGVLGSERLRTSSGRPAFLLAAVAGALLGLAMDNKIWYVIAAVVLVAWFWRRAIPLVAGIAVAMAVVYLPFFAAAPASMWRMVVTDQLGRPRASLHLLQRLSTAFGAPHPTGHGFASPITNGSVALVVSLGIALLVVLAATTGGARVFVLLFGVDFALLLTTPVLFWHYAALTAPPLALVVGVGVARLAAIPTGPRLRRAVPVVAVVLIGLITAGSLATWSIGRGVNTRTPTSGLQAAARGVHGCIIADDPTMLALMDVLSSQIDRDCPLRPDSTGYTYDRDALKVDGRLVARPKNPIWQADARAYLTSGAAVILVWKGSQLSHETRAAVTAGPVLFHHGVFTLYGTTH